MNKKTTGVKYGGYTKEEIRELIKIWDDFSVDEIAERLGRQKPSIVYIANQMRKVGFQLQRKRVVGHLNSLLMDVLAEQKRK